MRKSLETKLDSIFFGLELPFHQIDRNFSEQLASDRPLAVQVAEPLCKAGLRASGIVEKIEYNASLKTPIEEMPMHIFTLLLQGEMAVQVGDDLKWLKPGEIVYTPPLSPYRRVGKPKKPVWFLYIEFFDIAQWETMKENGPFSHKYEDAGLMFMLLRRILDVHRSRNGVERARSYSQALLEMIRQEVPNKTQKLKSERRKKLDQLVGDIHNDPGQSWSISTMSKKLHMSRATLIRLFQSEYGVPPRTLIIHQRIAFASKLLTKSNAKINEIASRVGYDSAFTFSNLFLKQTGLRPGAFRKRYGNLSLEKEL